MKPQDIAGKSEASHQSAFFAYVAYAAQHGFIGADFWVADKLHLFEPVAWQLTFPQHALKWIHAIPNGGSRHKAEASALKAQGVRPGVADIFVPIPIIPYHGLYIEFKTEDGRISPEQDLFSEHALRHGYQWRVARSWKEGVKELKWYLGV